MGLRRVHIHLVIDLLAALGAAAGDDGGHAVPVEAELEQEMTRWEELSLRAEEQEN